MKKCIIFFPKISSSGLPDAFSWWMQAAATYGIDAKICFFEDFGFAKLRDKPDFVVMRGYDSRISLFYENQGVKVINTWEAMDCSHNKWKTYTALLDKSIPTPFTVLINNKTTFDSLAKELGTPFVVKQTNGSQGYNVYLVNTTQEYLEAYGQCQYNAIAQKYISTSHGHDVRVWVIGNHAVACVLRYSKSSFISNYSQGGQAKSYPLTADIAKLAVDASNACGLFFSGVDLLFAPDGNFTVCEVNGNAGFRTLSEVSDFNILNTFFSSLEDYDN